jgi:hypothetical protein
MDLPAIIDENGKLFIDLMTHLAFSKNEINIILLI